MTVGTMATVARYFVPLNDDELPSDLGKLYVMQGEYFVDPEGDLLVTLDDDLVVEILDD